MIGVNCNLLFWGNRCPLFSILGVSHCIAGAQQQAYRPYGWGFARNNCFGGFKCNATVVWPPPKSANHWIGVCSSAVWYSYAHSLKSKYKRTTNRALPGTIALARLRGARSSLTTSEECWSRDSLRQQKHVQHATVRLWPPPKSAGRGIHYVNRSAYNMQQFMAVSRIETDKM